MLTVITTSQITTVAKKILITIRKNIITTALKVMVLKVKTLEVIASEVTVLKAIVLKVRILEATASKVINLEVITTLDPVDLLTETSDQATEGFGNKFI